MLVTTEQLAANLGDRSWVIFDCRHDLTDLEKGARLYREGHIKGANFASVERDLSGLKTGTNGRHPLPDPQAFADFLARHGVSEHTIIAAYDDAGGLYAARLWWMTRWIGQKHAVLLDGGWQKWVAEGRPTSTERPNRAPAMLLANTAPWMIWNASQVARRLQDPESGLIDARAPERFRGDVEPIDPVAGHIPGAVNRFYKLNLNPDFTFRSKDELKRDFQALLGRRRAEMFGHQCGSGITACANIFAMEYAGFHGSKLYPGSWSEWISKPERPVARG